MRSSDVYTFGCTCRSCCNELSIADNIKDINLVEFPALSDSSNTL